MNKKIGILTYHYSNNYGAVLQAFSLQNVLKSMGYDVSLINLIPNHGIKGKLKDVITAPFTKTFTKFREDYFQLYPTKPFTYDTIDKINFDDFHCLIVGSDQVWRKDYTEGLGHSYFLDFAPKHVKKISYAASFGLDYYQGDQNDINVIKNCLKSFDLVTLRENSGVKICKELFEIEGKMVLDPVFLSSTDSYNFNKTNNSQNKTKGFITQYLLDATEKKKNLSNLVAKNFNKKIVQNYKENTKKLSIYNLIFDRKKERFPKIEDWINNIQNSEFVITDSFHGVALSILFNKQFICIFNEKRGKTRMQNLMKIFNLEHRAISENEIDDFQIDNYKPIDYDKVNTILETEKSFALNLLSKHLN